MATGIICREPYLSRYLQLGTGRVAYRKRKSEADPELWGGGGGSFWLTTPTFQKKNTPTSHCSFDKKGEI